MRTYIILVISTVLLFVISLKAQSLELDLTLCSKTTGQCETRKVQDPLASWVFMIKQGCLVFKKDGVAIPIEPQHKYADGTPICHKV